MFAGSLIFETPIDTKGVEVGSQKIEGEFGGLKKVANETGKAINSAFSGDFSKQVALAQARINDLMRQYEALSASFNDAVAADDDSAAEKYGRQRIRVYDQIEAARERLLIAVQEASRKQTEAEKKAAEKAEKAHKKSLSNVGKSFGSLEKTAKRFGTRLKSVITGALVFNLISSGLREFTSYFGSAIKSNQEFSTHLAKLKGALLTAFQPIYTYVLPAIIRLMQWLTSAANAVAYFFSILTGKSIQDSAKAAENLYKEAKAIGTVGSAAKKASKGLAGFDEINLLPSTDNAGAESGSSVVAPDFSDLEGLFISTEADLVLSKLKQIGEYIPSIIAALGGLKLGSFVTDLLTANIEAKTLKETFALLGKKAGLTLGITLAITGVALETKGIISAFQEGLNGINFAEILGGGGMLAGGGALIGQFFGSAVLGGAIGGIVAGIPAFIAGVYDAIVGGIDWLNAALVGAGATAAGAGIGAIVGMLGGPIGAGIGALIGLAVGLVTDLVILIVQKWDEICAFFATAAEWFEVNVIRPVGEFFAELWTSISQWASDVWEDIKEFFTPAVDWFSELLLSIGQTFEDVFYNIGVIVSGCWEIIKAVWNVVATWFDENIIEPVAGFFEALWTDISDWARGAWENICSVFSGVATWVDDNVIQPIAGFFKGLWDDISNWADDLWKDITEIFGNVVGFFKDILNGVIEALNAAIRWIFGGVNSILASLKNIEVAGITPFSGIRTINVPQIPYLAQGAVLPANKPFMAVVGDQRHGTNIEAPLTTIQEAVANVMNENISAMMAGFEALLEENRQLRQVVEGIEVGDATIGEAVNRYNRKMAVVRGG